MHESFGGKARRMRRLAEAATTPERRIGYLERAAIFEARAGGLMLAVPLGRSRSGAAQTTIWALPARDK